MNWEIIVSEWYPVLAFIGYVFVILTIGGRVLITGKPVGVSLAWLLLIIILPVIGALLYLLFGESYIGFYRARRAQSAFDHYITSLQSLPVQPAILSISDSDPAKPLWDQTFGAINLPAYDGNAADILTDPEDILSQIKQDIQSAEKSIYLEFYICEPGGRVSDIFQALQQAQNKGVSVCLILDSVGSRGFLRSDFATQLKEQGIIIIEALYANPFRILLRRQDLRMHRKLIVIDGKLAYTGSMNLVDPLVFNQSAGVGYWIDLVVRVQGPVVPSMEYVFLNDWQMEKPHSDVSASLHVPLPIDGGIPIQVVPSGPALAKDNLIHLLLTAIYSARVSVEITTPYFVPDDAILLALNAAAQRGVEVSIYLPFKNNSFLAKHAGRSFYDELINNGVRICPFRDGLLHTKCVLIDKQVALVGTVNLDMRSIWLNFEITLVVSDKQFCQKLAKIIEAYNAASDTIDLQRWRNRSMARKILEHVTRLLSPLL